MQCQHLSCHFFNLPCKQFLFCQNVRCRGEFSSLQNFQCMTLWLSRHLLWGYGGQNPACQDIICSRKRWWCRRPHEKVLLLFSFGCWLSLCSLQTDKMPAQVASVDYAWFGFLWSKVIFFWLYCRILLWFLRQITRQHTHNAKSLAAI